MKYAMGIIPSTHPKNDLITVGKYKSKPDQKVDPVNERQGKSEPEYGAVGKIFEAASQRFRTLMHEH